jgi:alkylation response protein AidB-like acyl-CoA dehydrogenase
MTTTRDDLLVMSAALRKALADGVGWPGLAELGVTGFCAAEDLGGFGGEAPAALMAARELGAALQGDPYPAAVAASYALTRWLEKDREQVADEVISGAHVPTVAFLRPGAVVTGGAGLRVDGRADVVAGAAGAGSFLLLPAEDTLPAKDTLAGGGHQLLFARRDETCTVTSRDVLDVTREIGDVAFSGTPAVPLAAPAGGRALVERLHGLLLAGDTLGGLAKMLDQAVAYAAGRTAFGKAIGGYQAVQHRLVDHAVTLRGMSLLADEAAARLAPELGGTELGGTESGGGAAEAGRAALLAEESVASRALPMLHDLVQLTGAIGFTWEYGLHLYERRAHLNARLGRNPRRARRLLADSEGWAR